MSPYLTLSLWGLSLNLKFRGGERFPLRIVHVERVFGTRNLSPNTANAMGGEIGGDEASEVGQDGDERQSAFLSSLLQREDRGSEEISPASIRKMPSQEHYYYV